MNEHVAQSIALVDLLGVVDLGGDRFEGVGDDGTGRPMVFGGHVAGQALAAASATVESDRRPHSLHSYFLRAGRTDLPIHYHVARDRDGRSFSARTVTASQDGRTIFTMLLSFQVPRPGAVVDEAPSRSTPPPEDAEPHAWTPLVEARELTRTDLSSGRMSDWLWVRSATPIPDDPVAQASCLVFLSDFGSGFGQSTVPGLGPGRATLDHAVWFHHHAPGDDWLLIELIPEKAVSGRGLYRGSIRDRSGNLVASVAQELLMPGESDPTW